MSYAGGAEAKRAYDAARYQKKKAEIRARNEAWKTANPEKYRAGIDAWRKRNADHDKAVKKAYEKCNRDKLNALAKQRRLKNPAPFRAAQRRYREANPEWNRTRKGVGKIPRGTIQQLLMLQKSKCVGCKARLGSKFHVDHIMPLALGGAHEKKNFQILCAPCNQEKYIKHPIDFMRTRGFLL